jgi:hypothetical protein
MARNNRRENASRGINHDYKAGYKVLLKKPGSKHLRTLEPPRIGPHTVTAIYIYEWNFMYPKG